MITLWLTAGVLAQAGTPVTPPAPTALLSGDSRRRHYTNFKKGLKPAIQKAYRKELTDTELELILAQLNVISDLHETLLRITEQILEFRQQDEEASEAIDSAFERHVVEVLIPEVKRKQRQKVMQQRAISLLY